MAPRLALVALLAAPAAGHGNMVYPYTWFDAARGGLAPRAQCSVAPQAAPTVNCMWFTNDTTIPGEPTLPRDMITFPTRNDTQRNPWRAPGSAPVFSPCGVAGGNPRGCPVGGAEGNCPGGGFGYGPAAEDAGIDTAAPTTEWTRGGTAEVGWAILANHGGGYSYRLCPRPAAGGKVTEECFQRTPLAFHGSTQWVQAGEDGARTYFTANRTREGTTPAGSQWTKSPIPACRSADGGFSELLPGCLRSGAEFPPPAPGLLGFGEQASLPGRMTFDFTVFDEVAVPDVPAGEYVLSFRWDCEQTPQIWSACANIRVVE